MSTLSKRHRPRASQGDIRPCEGMRHVNPYAAGVDIGAQEMMAGVPAGDEQHRVRVFGTYPVDLEARADWCIDHGIQTVAMASTGVSWIPLFATLEARGLQGCLSSAASITRVPGRQSDVLDGQWMQTLQRDGVLSASCRPDADFVALRTLLRHRAPLLQPRAPHVLPMPKALVQRQIQWSPALREGTGDTGPRLSRAMVAGERAPHPRATWRHSRGQTEADEIARALTGPWREAPLVVLKHALALFDCSTAPLRAGDGQSAGTFAGITPRVASAPTGPAPVAAPEPPRRQPHAHSQHAPAVPTRAPLLRLTGVDVVAVHGISDAMAQTILAEIGTNMSTWPDEQHCCSWLGLAPKHAIAGGKVLRSRTRNNHHDAAHAFRRAAPSVRRSHGAFGAWPRRLHGRLGPVQGLVATAHKIARTVSHMLKERVPYHDSGAAEYTQRFRERERHSFQKKAAKLGDTLSPA